jgi:hypothetical protein
MDVSRTEVKAASLLFADSIEASPACPRDLTDNVSPDPEALAMYSIAKFERREEELQASKTTCR